MELPRYLSNNPRQVNSVPRKLADGRASAGWTDEKIAALRDLVAAGHTFGEIGRTLHLTRNAAIGKAKRLGIAQPGRPVEQINETKRQGLKLRQRRRKRPPSQTRRVRIRTGALISFKTVLAPYLTDVRPSIAANPITITQLKYHHCRWPCDGHGATMTYCGGTKLDGSSYCGRHREISIRKNESNDIGD